MKVDHKNNMFQIMIKILVCMYILIFYSNNVFSKTYKNILNKTNFQIQAIILSNLGSGVGLSYKLILFETTIHPKYRLDNTSNLHILF